MCTDTKEMLKSTPRNVNEHEGNVEAQAGNLSEHEEKSFSELLNEYRDC
jgi:hypothetical protein